MPAGGSRDQRSTVTSNWHVRVGSAIEEQGYGRELSLTPGANQRRAVTADRGVHTRAALQEFVDVPQIAGLRGFIQSPVQRGRNSGPGLSAPGPG